MAVFELLAVVLEFWQSKTMLTKDRLHLAARYDPAPMCEQVLHLGMSPENKSKWRNVSIHWGIMSNEDVSTQSKRHMLAISFLFLHYIFDITRILFPSAKLPKCV